MLFRILSLLLIAGLAACVGPGSKQSIAARMVAANAALSEIGVPYRYGGNDQQGFDCSGLVQYAYAQAGVVLPRSTSEQMKIGNRIAYADARVGDLLFYRFTDRKHPSMHVAIFLGDEQMVHAPASGQSVVKTRTDQKPWPKRYVTAVRVLR